MLSPETIARFWTKVEVREPDECWRWTAATRSKNAPYGALKIDGQVRLAHRVSFEGRANLNARLTDTTVAAIRRDRAAGMKLVPLAAKYGVGYSTVRDVVHRRTWTHVA